MNLLFALLACASDLELIAHADTSPPEPELDQIERRAAPAIVALAAAHGVADPADLVIERSWIDALETGHVRIRQELDGVPVFGAEAIVHLDEWGTVLRLTDNLLDDVAVDTTPILSGADAIAIAGPSSDAELMILRGDRDRLVWCVRVHGGTRPVVFIDAHSGREVWRYDGLKRGTGRTRWYGEVPFVSSPFEGGWTLEDGTRAVGTYTCDHTSSDIYLWTDADDRWPSSAHEAIEAHYAASAGLDYFRDTFGRQGVDGAWGPAGVEGASVSGGLLPVIVQCGEDPSNAAWTGSSIEIGSGDGVVSGPMTTLDIVGHELTHGVTQYSANLTYYGEPGALDESIADCFGAMIEREVLGESADTWTIGEATWTPGVATDALRYLADPANDGSTRDWYPDRQVGSADNGGVHANAGVGNLAFYLAAEGGSHPRRGGEEVLGVGAEAAAAIWYRALTTYMTASTTFQGARAATAFAASDLYGPDSPAVTAVNDAWEAVGVAGMDEDTSCRAGDYAVCRAHP